MSDLEKFRRETRAWLEANCPPEMRRPMTSEADTFWGGRNTKFSSEPQRVWFERMRDKGWTVPHWPKEYGGGGLDRRGGQDRATRKWRAIGARAPLTSFGISMLGPALLKYGTEAQKKEHLPKIAAGEIRWCQGYSEPGAGSDLASLQTRAESEGDHFVINGQKIWTSYANHADWIFCLVRTDATAKKHDGISFMLFDMASPGRLDQADPADLAATRRSARPSSTMCRCRRTIWSAPSTAAGTSPSICCSTSAR